jgi:hypothetical protein
MQIGDLVKCKSDLYHPTENKARARGISPSWGAPIDIIPAGSVGIITDIRDSYSPPRITLMITTHGVIATEFSSIKWELVNE